MRLAFVYPPYVHKRFNENLQTVDDEFGKYPPLDLLYVASMLKKAGHDVILVDAHAENLTKEEALARVKDFGPQMLGFSLHSVYNFFDTLEWIRPLKEHLSVPVIAGGVCFTAYPEECMAHQEIDFGIVGTAHRTLLAFLAEFGGKKRFENLEGVAFRQGGNVRIKNVPQHKEPIRHFPLPARALIKNECYYQYISKRRNFTIMLTMTGCPYKCNFCAIARVPFTMRSAASVLAEIDNCYHKHGIREIDFFDAVFTINKRRLLKICGGLVERNYDLVWSCRSRIDNVDEELLRAMANAGCVRIYYGIEASDDHTLESIRKDMTLEHVQDIVNLTKKQGIMALGFFIIGNPGETRESARRTIRYAKGLGLDYAQFSMMLGKPDTPLYEAIMEDIGYDYWGEYIRGNVPEQPLPNPWSELSREEILALTKEAYIRFYFTPARMVNLARAIHSWDEFRRYVKAGLKMAFIKG